MTDFDLLQLIGEADDQFVMDSRRRPKKTKKKKYLPYAIAACAALVILGGTGALMLRSGSSASPMADQADIMMAAEVAEAEQPAEFATEAAAPAAGNNDMAEPDAVEPAAPGITLLAAPEYPKAIGLEDFDAASANWMENQTSDETKTALNTFSYATAARVLRGREDSGCFSPLSLYQALAILASGAEGQTRDQILSLLGQSDPDTLAEQVGKLYRVNYTDNESDILKIANSLWLDDTDGTGAPVEFHQDWVLSAAAAYYAEIYGAEFASRDTAEALGTWIADKTGGMLRPSPETLRLDPDTVMAIVNTLWFKSQWADRFEEEDTNPAEFTTGAGETVSCDFMHRTEMGGSVVQTEEYTKSALHLSRGRMIFVLPAEGVSVDDLLTEEKLWEVFENGDYTSADVEWSLPKFETNATYQLEDMLQELGVADAFDADMADFSPITDTPLYVGQVQQGTHIAVNEDGVEAAAYTMIQMAAGAAAPQELPTVEMNLNRPFLYLITANDGTTLFVGAVRNPAA